MSLRRRYYLASLSVLRRRLLGVCLAFLSTQAFAAEAEVPVLRVGTSGDYTPFSFRERGGGAPAGFDIAVADRFAGDAGYRLKWVAFRWPELARRFEAGDFDLVMSGITVRPERSAAGRFTVPVMRSGAVLLYRRASFAGRAATADDPGVGYFDQAGRSIAVNLGGHLERLARAQFRHAELVVIGDNAAVRTALAEGRVDAAVTDSLEAGYWKHDLEGVESFGPWTHDYKAYWVRAARPQLAQQLDQWLLAREADGTLAQLRRSATGRADLEPTARPFDALLAATAERLALMLPYQPNRPFPNFRGIPI